MGYHHRTEINKKVYRIANGADKKSASTNIDITDKAITPLGGFPHYGVVNHDFIMIKGCCVGPKKKIVLLRKTLVPQISRFSQEQINLKFIDTSSKLGHGRFQTQEEKKKFYGRVYQVQKEVPSPEKKQDDIIPKKEEAAVKADKKKK